MKIKTWKKKFQRHSNQKKSEVAILMSDKIEFKSKIVITQKMLKKGEVIKNITIINVYRLHNKCPKYFCDKNTQTSNAMQNPSDVRISLTGMHIKNRKE